METVTNSLIQNNGIVANSKSKMMGTVTKNLIQNDGKSRQQLDPK
jgi:hypothetical protein